LNQRDSGFVHRAFDLHFGWIGQVDDRLTFSNRRSSFDHKLGVASTTAELVRVNDDAVRGSVHHAAVELLFQVSLFSLSLTEFTSHRCQGRFCGFDVAIKLNEHLLSSQILQDSQSTLSTFELISGIGDRKFVRFQLK